MQGNDLAATNGSFAARLNGLHPIYMTPDHDRLAEQTRQARADFLLTDADMTSTLLDLADATRSDESRDRRRKLAADAYRTLVEFMSRSNLTDTQRAILHHRLSAIRVRLSG